LQLILSLNLTLKFIPYKYWPLQDVLADLFEQSETTEFAGKAVVALTADPNRIQKSGKIHITADLAAEYGFKDINGD
jgi:hypothetical protein